MIHVMASKMVCWMMRAEKRTICFKIVRFIIGSSDEWLHPGNVIIAAQLNGCRHHVDCVGSTTGIVSVGCCGSGSTCAGLERHFL